MSEYEILGEEVFQDRRLAINKRIPLSGSLTMWAYYRLLQWFAKQIIERGCFNGEQLDGFDIQELAEKLGLIEEHEATEADIDEDSDFEVGDTIYKFTDILKGK